MQNSFMKKRSELWDKMTHLSFLFFYPVTETSFHRTVNIWTCLWNSIGSLDFLGKCSFWTIALFVSLSIIFLILSVPQGSHHIVLDRSMFKRCTTAPHKNPRAFSGFCKKEKMLCAECKHDWGLIASYLTIQVTLSILLSSKSMILTTLI